MDVKSLSRRQKIYLVVTVVLVLLSGGIDRKMGHATANSHAASDNRFAVFAEDDNGGGDRGGEDEHSCEPDKVCSISSGSVFP